MAHRLNTLICGDTEYTLTQAYRDGAMAMRRQTPHFANPFRDGTQSAEDWDQGHTNEAAGEHVRFGTDVISARPRGAVFADDTDIPRLPCGDVDETWYRTALAEASATAAAT